MPGTDRDLRQGVHLVSQGHIVPSDPFFLDC